MPGAEGADETFDADLTFRNDDALSYISTPTLTHGLASEHRSSFRVSRSFRIKASQFNPLSSDKQTRLSPESKTRPIT